MCGVFPRGGLPLAKESSGRSVGGPQPSNAACFGRRPSFSHVLANVLRFELPSESQSLIAGLASGTRSRRFAALPRSAALPTAPCTPRTASVQRRRVCRRLRVAQIYQSAPDCALLAASSQRGLLVHSLWKPPERSRNALGRSAGNLSEDARRSTQERPRSEQLQHPREGPTARRATERPGD